MPSFDCLYSIAMRFAMAATSAVAASSDTPGLRRAASSTNWPLPRSSFVASIWMGIQIECACGYTNLGGMMPTTVYGTPFARIDVPMMEGSPE